MYFQQFQLWESAESCRLEDRFLIKYKNCKYGMIIAYQSGNKRIPKSAVKSSIQVMGQDDSLCTSTVNPRFMNT